uniref:uncharacterized protein LOC122587770 n=1 Tax=Erigeron canadensis TaxID=72917 RepID=UPI001CB9AA37|nr:uncharacterized protein LOC122587770 [Erigeron canadensis]
MKYSQNLEYYDGIGVAMIQRWDMPITCHAFSCSLVNDAREWIDSLPADSINNFETLKTKFRSQFNTQKKHRKTHVSAHNIKRQSEEMLRDFIRYTHETQEISGLPESQRISGLIQGLRAVELVEHLTKNMPETYHEKPIKSHIWIDVKGINRSTEYALGKQKRDPTDSRTKSPIKNPRWGSKASEGRKIMMLKLTKSPKDILAMEQVVQTFPTPPRLTIRKRDREKYCAFHKDYGNDTDLCRNLQQSIEDAIIARKLHRTRSARELQQE